MHTNLHGNTTTIVQWPVGTQVQPLQAQLSISHASLCLVSQAVLEELVIALVNVDLICFKEVHESPMPRSPVV